MFRDKNEVLKYKQDKETKGNKKLKTNKTLNLY